jgi:phage terminase small subunit
MRQSLATRPEAMTPKQEAFARAYVETGNASEAYRRSYNVKETTKPETVWVKACETLKVGKVRERVNQLQAAAQEKTLVTVDSLVAELEEARQAALTATTPQAGAATAATLGKAKLLGLVVEKIDATVKTKELPASVDEFV